MPRTLILTLSGVMGLAALMGTALTASEGRLHSGLLQRDVAAQNQLVSNDLTEMTMARLEQILESEVTDLEGNGGVWRGQVDGRSVIVLADSSSNRMRVIAPVVAASSLSEEQIQAMLEANFHSALDARYSISDGAVVSVFIHPLSTLQESDFRSGLSQAVTLAETFGSTYSSGGLGFLPNGQGREAPTVPGGGIEI
ncbi:MAG: hypothetical protein AAFY30_04430 [Cyanobacteria bacterium J06642_12]